MRILAHQLGRLQKTALLICLGLLMASAAAFAAGNSTESTGQKSVVRGTDGWLFLDAELHFLKCASFWGEAASKVSRSTKPEVADPVPAIVDFHRQLGALGVRLLLVPVPPKASLSLHAPKGDFEGKSRDSLTQFYAVLRHHGVEVVDLRPVFRDGETKGQPMFCKTDSHWSGEGCISAAKVVAESLKKSLPAARSSVLQATWQRSRSAEI